MTTQLVPMVYGPRASAERYARVEVPYRSTKWAYQSAQGGEKYGMLLAAHREHGRQRGWSVEGKTHEVALTARDRIIIPTLD